MKRLFIAILSMFILFLSVFSSGFVFYKNIGTISLVFEGKEVFNEDITININSYVENKIFYRGNYFRHYYNRFQGNPIGYLSYLNDDLAYKVSELKQTLDKEKIEPYYEYRGNGEFAYFEGTNGIEVDIDALASAIIANISRHATINVPYKNIEVSLTFADLVSRTQKLAKFSTNYQSSSSGRKNNIKVATDRLNGAIILSGETLSFNQIVGERTVENGFNMAKIIQNGEFIEGVGGGVCQVSSTLYNACLLSGQSIEKSATHSLPVSYVSPSLDAMVSSSSDLVIKNTSPYPVYLYGSCDGKTLTFAIYGYSCGYKIKTRSVILKQLICQEYEIIATEPVPDGAEYDLVVEKEPKSGLVSESYRDYFNEEGLVYTERLRRSVYAPQKGIKYKVPRVD